MEALPSVVHLVGVFQLISSSWSSLDESWTYHMLDTNDIKRIAIIGLHVETK